MIRRYIWHGGEWVLDERRRRASEAPYIVKDGMDPVQHMGNGRVYDSKSAFRRATRDLHLVELGNDAPAGTSKIPVDRKELREDIRQAMAQVAEGRRVAPAEPVPGETVRRYDR